MALDRGVAWTEALREEVWSARGSVNPKFEAEGIEQSRDRKSGFAERRRYMGSDPHLRPYFEAGLARVAPQERAMMQAALDIRDDKTEPASLDQDTEVALVALEIQHVFTSVPYWVAKESLPFAMRTLARCHEYHSSGHDHGYSKSGVWVVHAPDEAGSYPEYADSGWKLLRALLAAADDKTYAQMRDVAKEIWKAADPTVRALIACVFTTERAWADEAARAVIAQGKAASGFARCLVTVASVELGAKLARPEWAFDEDMLLTLLAREGAEAVPVLSACLATAGNNDERKRYAKILAMIETEDAVRAFVPWIANRTLNPIATKHAKRIPEMARGALGPVARSKGPHQASARTLLAIIGDE